MKTYKLEIKLKDDNREVDAEDTPDTFFRYKLIKQISLCTLLLCLGLCVGTIGPTLPDMRDRLGVDYESVSNALIFESLGVIVGAAISGLLNDNLPRFTDLMLAVSFLLVAAVYASVPWAPSLEVLAVALFFGGFAKGNIDIGTNTAVMHMWGEKSATPMHSLHFAFGIGALSAPQIARPFLGESQDLSSDDASPTSGYNNSLNSSTELPREFMQIEDDSNIEYAYMIVASATCLAALSYLTFHIYGFPEGFPRRTGTKLSLEMCSPGQCGRGSVFTGILYLSLLFLFFFNAVGGEIAYATYIYTFGVDKENPLSTDDAANLNTVFFACFTAGRGLGVLISKFLSTDTMVLLDLLLYVASAIVLLLFGYQNVIILWIFSGFTGLFLSILFPAGMAWANTYLDVNGMLVMVLIVGANVGALSYKYITGAFFDSYGPETLMYVNFAAAVLLLTVFMFMYGVTFKTRRRK